MIYLFGLPDGWEYLFILLFLLLIFGLFVILIVALIRYLWRKGK